MHKFNKKKARNMLQENVGFLGNVDVDDPSKSAEVELPEDVDAFKYGGEIKDRDETYSKWKSLVNMSNSELKDFYNSKEGKIAGLSATEAKSQGIDSGRESARWIMKMKDTSKDDWNDNMWRWAKKQISFISRMKGMKGDLYDDKGRKTRKHTSLLIWGHNPEKYNEGGDLPVGKLARGMSLSEVAAVHGLTVNALKNQLVMGIETEMEHTDKAEYARAIALDHLYEDPKYYTKLSKMENIDKHFEDITEKFANGGQIDPIFSFKTPTGEPSRLSYIQQVLVRTNAFKNFFGDWEYAAKSFIRDGKQNFEKHFKNVSKVLDYVTLEPRVVFHGTRSENEFYDFDVTMQDKQGRPYAYFAHNIEYAENFTRMSQRMSQDSKPFIFKCFLNVRNPFMAISKDFYDKSQTAKKWMQLIVDAIVDTKYPNANEQFRSALDSTVHSQIKNYVDTIYPNDSAEKFWKLMAADKDKNFKFFLIAYGFDGVFYSEEFQAFYDVDNPAQFTKAVTIFDAKQIKLADGRNTYFDPMNPDIRYKEGGKTATIEHTSQINHSNMNKLEKLDSLMSGGGDKFAEGGKVVGHNADPNNAKEGGYFKGRSHAQGGIKAINRTTNQPIEVEGGEVIITKRAVDDNSKREFEGKMMTNREILSHINQGGGGVAFAEGGEVDGQTCGCSGHEYKFGGETMSDFNIVYLISKTQDKIQDSKKYLNDFIQNVFK